MDVFLSEGIEIVFKVALALLTVGKNDLLSLDMESILKVNINIFISCYLCRYFCADIITPTFAVHTKRTASES